MDTAPQYEHDCTLCKFLGIFGVYDLYFCPKEPTIIARKGNAGSEYSSGLRFGIIFGIMSDEVRPGERNPLRECLERALKIPEYRNIINEYVILYESPERIAQYREILKSIKIKE